MNQALFGCHPKQVLYTLLIQRTIEFNDARSMTQEVAIIGIVTPENLPTMLNAPVEVALNANKAFLYASDQNNHRVQRFKLFV